MKLLAGDAVPDAFLGQVLARGGSRLFTRPMDSWLDRRSGEVCYEPLEPRGDRVCAALGRDPRESVAPRDYLFSLRSYPSLHELRAEGRYVVRYSIPIHARGDDPRRVVTLVDHDPNCLWAIELPGDQGPRETTLDRTEKGPIVFTRQYGVPGCRTPDRRMPPCFIETREDEGWLRDLARESARE